MAQLVTINVAQLVTIKMAKRGPVSNFTAYIYIYIYGWPRPLFRPKFAKKYAWDCSEDRFWAFFLIDFYRKIAPTELVFLKRSKTDSSQNLIPTGFVNVVNVVNPHVIQKVLRTRVLLMLLIFWGNYSTGSRIAC